MKQKTSVGVRLGYEKIRNVSTPEETANGAETYIGVLPLSEILKVGTSGNLRTYIPGHPGKKRSMVHKSIGNTIRNRPERFSQLNSGFLIGASKVKVDDARKEIQIWDASVNNGAQTQGEIAAYVAECEEDGVEPEAFHVRVEISVEPDEAMRTDIAIARNTTTRIQDISQAGKRGYFDDLDASFRRFHRTSRLAHSETDIGDEYVDTRLLLQVCWVLMPQELARENRTSIEARMRAYKNAAQCLTDFEAIFHARNEDPAEAERYRYFCDIAGPAWALYEKWRDAGFWEGTYLRAGPKQVRQQRGRSVVADGLVFPALSALSNFVVKREGAWTIATPPVFKDEDLRDAARRQLTQHQGKPMLMGRSGAAYEGLMLLTEMARRYAAAA